MSDVQELKNLRNQISRLNERLLKHREEYQKLGVLIESTTKEKMRIENQINHLMKKNDLIVSEHAILRYLERVENINIDAITDKILTDELINIYKVAGDGKYKLNDVTFVIKNKTVTTILKK